MQIKTIVKSFWVVLTVATLGVCMHTLKSINTFTKQQEIKTEQLVKLQPPSLEIQAKNSYRLDILMDSFDHPLEICSITAIAPHVLAGATHCFINPETKQFNVVKMRANGAETKILRQIVNDGNDHSLVYTDATYTDFAKIGPKMNVNDDIHYWGNASGSNNLYRRGYVVIAAYNFVGLDSNGFAGDSGAAIYNKDGQMVGIISDMAAASQIRKDSAGITVVTLKYMLSLNFAFTAEDLVKVGLDPTDPNYKNLIGPKPPKELQIPTI